MAIRTATKLSTPATLLRILLREVQALRREVHAMIPEESLDEYENASDITRAIRRAHAKYPPASA